MHVKELENSEAFLEEIKEEKNSDHVERASDQDQSKAD